MSTTSLTRAQQIKAGLNHPVIDADGHTIEVTPALQDFIKEVGGPGAVNAFTAWQPTPSHWTWPARTVDRATAALPRLYYDRMQELGLDFSLVYPTLALRMQMIADEDLRLVLCRAMNLYMSEVHAGLADRLLPVASIPMHTPEEAISEIKFAVNELGMRAVLMPSYVCRRAKGDEVGDRFDTYGIDSQYDYDPVWATCVELSIVPSVHTASHGYGFRRSTNYVYNHVGSFSTSCEAVCKSLIMGGVFHRFPTLKLAALEGGVGWAASLYADFLSHWEKRNGKVIRDLDPANLDNALLLSLIEQYGSRRIATNVDAIVDSIVNYRPAPDRLDEFSSCPFDNPQDICDLFVSHIFVGCEADDPLNALAFNSQVNPLGARFRVIFGSDIGHWDVPDISEVLVEAYELVDDGLITEQDFQDFTFSNAAQLYGGTNPDFFKGTGVESAVVEHLRSTGS